MGAGIADEAKGGGRTGGRGVPMGLGNVGRILRIGLDVRNLALVGIGELWHVYEKDLFVVLLY